MTSNQGIKLGHFEEAGADLFSIWMFEQVLLSFPLPHPRHSAERHGFGDAGAEGAQENQLQAGAR